MRAKIGSYILKGTLLGPEEVLSLKSSGKGYFISRQMNKVVKTEKEQSEKDLVSDNENDENSSDESDGRANNEDDSDDDHFEGQQKELAMDNAEKFFGEKKNIQNKVDE